MTIRCLFHVGDRRNKHRSLPQHAGDRRSEGYGRHNRGAGLPRWASRWSPGAARTRSSIPTSTLKSFLEADHHEI
jgi:hypothetical protein